MAPATRTSAWRQVGRVRPVMNGPIHAARGSGTCGCTVMALVSQGPPGKAGGGRMADMSREEVLARYRHLRAISTRHHTEALRFLSRPALLEQARQLGLTTSEMLVAESMDEFTLVVDLAIHTSRPGRSRAIDRYAGAAQLQPGSDEALVQPWCMDRRRGRDNPRPRPGSGDADVIRASQLQHAVERLGGDCHLGRPTLVRARAQPVADHPLPPRDGGLGPGPLRVPGRLLPAHPAVRGDEPEVAGAPRRLGPGRLARHRRRARRDDDGRLGVALRDAVVDAILIVPAVAGERGQRARHLIER